MTQSDFVPRIVEYYSNISVNEDVKKNNTPRLCYYIMSMEGDSDWEHHVKNPSNKEIKKEIHEEINPLPTPLKIGRLRTGIFDVKAYLTVQVRDRPPRWHPPGGCHLHRDIPKLYTAHRCSAVQIDTFCEENPPPKSTAEPIF